MRRLCVVLFDLDDTLHNDTLAYHNAAEQVALEIAAERSIDAVALKTAYVSGAENFWQQLSAEQLKSKLRPLREELWESALSTVGIDDRELAVRCAASYDRYRRGHLELFPGALDLLQRLKARGIKLGLVTNGFAETHREKIALLRIGELFDAMFLADEVGMLKPDPLLFAHACAKLGCSPSTGAMVGDRYERDIRGALTAGLFTVWINLHDAPLAADLPQPHATVRTLAEVAEALGLSPQGSLQR